MQSSPLQLGPVAIHVAVYTTEGTFYVARTWTAQPDAFECTDLVNGENGESLTPAPARLIVRNLGATPRLARLGAECDLPIPVKAIKFSLRVPNMPMLAPESVSLTPYTWRQWDFPRDWRAGFALWQGEGELFTVVTHDFPWRFKRIRALRVDDEMTLEIIQDANLRERSFAFATSEWEIGWRDAADALLDDYADFARQAFGALDFAQRRDAPAWLRGVGLVVNMHGTDWNGCTNLDFDGMAAAAETLAGLFPADQTLLYPIGWDGRYMRDYPTFEPSAGLGGAAGFARFCRRARELGFHVMPHLNAMVCNMRQRLYDQHLKHYVIRDGLGLPQNLTKIDWDHDGLGDPAHSYLALQPPALRDVLVRVVERLVREFGIDAIFLDETCNVFYNDPAWDQVDGVRRLLRDIRRRCPGLLIAGEEWNEMLLGLTPLVQIWEETADGRGGFGREKSPLLRAWAGRFVRSCGYLALASADGHTGVHEWPDKPWQDERENEAYYIPTLALTKHTLERGMAGVQATVARAREYARRFAAPA